MDHVDDKTSGGPRLPALSSTTFSGNSLVSYIHIYENREWVGSIRWPWVMHIYLVIVFENEQKETTCSILIKCGS